MGASGNVVFLVVLFGAFCLFVDPELQGISVLALQSLKVPVVELAENDHGVRVVGHLQPEARLLVIRRVPGHLHARPLLGDVPLGREDPGAVEVLVLAQHVVVADPEDAVVAELVVQPLKPLSVPLFAAVRPRAGPLGAAPRVAHLHQPLAVALVRVDDGVRVLGDDSLPALDADRAALGRPPFAVGGGRGGEDEVGSDLPQLVVPELVFVQDVGGVDLGGHAARQVLDRFPRLAAGERGIRTVSFGEGLLEERHPRLVFVAALRKIERLAALLEQVVVGTLLVPLLDTIHAEHHVAGFIVGRGTKVELVVDDALVPITVAVEDEPVHADVGVLDYADVAHKGRVAGQDAEGGQQPAVAEVALDDVVGVGGVGEEGRLLEDLAHPLHIRGVGAA